MDATKLLLETRALQDETKKLRGDVEALKKAYDEVEEMLKRLEKEISLMEPIKKGEQRF